MTEQEFSSGTTIHDDEGLLVDRRHDPGYRWFVLHTRARQEKVLAAALKNLGASCYLPLRHVIRRYGKRRVESDVPLFPSYVFLWGSRTETALADGTHRVATLIDPSDQSTLDWELTNVHRALVRRAPLEPAPTLQRGMRVRVATGPYEGIEGEVADPDSDRLVLQIRALDSARSLDVRGARLEPLLG
jgi:transcriptional antiterminator RfaH